MVHKTDAADVLNRLQTLIGVSNDSQLASALDVNRQTLGSWRVRNSVPYELCVREALVRGAALDWLLTGEGPMLRGEAPEGMATANPREEAMLTLFRDLPEGEQREIHGAAADKKRLRQVEEKLDEVAAQVAAGKRAP